VKRTRKRFHPLGSKYERYFKNTKAVEKVANNYIKIMKKQKAMGKEFKEGMMKMDAETPESVKKLLKAKGLKIF